jgi:predicted ArsR family transcriptional regulator
VLSKKRSILVGSRARATLEAVARGGSMTVRDLVDALGVTTTAVREQVNGLHAEGWLVRSQRQGRTGRPADVFTLSEKANRLFAGQLDDFARLLAAEVFDLVGRKKGRELLARVGRRMARSVRQEVGGGSPKKRLGRLARFLAERGDLVQTGRTNEGLSLKLHRCPYGSLPEQHESICEMERATFSELIGATARLEKSCENGHRCCEFTIPPAGDEAGPAKPTKRRKADVDST